MIKTPTLSYTSFQSLINHHKKIIHRSKHHFNDSFKINTYVYVSRYSLIDPITTYLITLPLVSIFALIVFLIVLNISPATKTLS